jgi:hypothetical protein
MAGWLPRSGLLQRGRSKKTLLDTKQFFLCAQTNIDKSHRDTGTCMDAVGSINANSASQFHLAEFDATAGHQQGLPDPFWLIPGKKGRILDFLSGDKAVQVHIGCGI